MAEVDAEQKSKRPEDSAFKQQRLPAWQPLLTPKWVIGTFFVIGIIFLPIGIAIVLYSADVVEVTTRYDDCGLPVCTLNITIPAKMVSPIYVYYQLSNFYQNHRRYVKSRSDEQLRGSLGSLGTCTPIERNSANDIIVPCGLIANSFFNDTFNANVCPKSGGNCSAITWTNKGIAWTSDVEHKFKYVPLPASGYTNVSLDGSRQLPRVDDEEFIVWMRTAGLPTFKKLHRKITAYDLQEGDIIQLTATNQFPVSSFDGEKAFVLSTTSPLGGKNDFLGWAYIAVGCLCLALGLLFGLKQKIAPRPLGDMQHFNWSSGGRPTDQDS